MTAELASTVAYAVVAAEDATGLPSLLVLGAEPSERAAAAGGRAS